MILEVFLAYSSTERKALNIKVISLNNNDLVSLSEEYFLSFCEAILDCIDLEQLSLEHNNLGCLSSDRLNNLGESLSQLPNLERLSLRNNFLNVQTTTCLIKGCRNLQIIRLRDNNYLNNDELEQLKKLIVNNNKKKGLKVFEFLMLTQDQLSMLKLLDLSFDNFCSANSVPDLKLLEDIFLLCSSLEGINLDYNNLCHLHVSCLQALGKAISKCPNLKKLSLSGNRLNVSSIRCLTARCSKLEQVRLVLEVGDKFYINEQQHQELQQFMGGYNKQCNNTQTITKPKMSV